jgi:serine/threonine-protein kinase
LVTGEVPFQGDSPLAVMGQRVTSPAPLVRVVRRDVPPALEAVVFKALRRDPDERYASMAALRDELLHLDQVEIPAYAPEERRRVLPPPVLWTVIAVLVLVGLVLIGVLAEVLHRAQVLRAG